MRFLVDVDGVVADMVGALCRRVPGVEPTDFTSFEFNKAWGPAMCQVFYGVMGEPGFVASMSAYMGAHQMVDGLRELGEVVFATAPFGSATWARERELWLRRQFPSVEHVVHTSAKHLVRGDVIVEDRTANALSWLREHPEGRAVVVRRPWNAGDGEHPRIRVVKRVLDVVEVCRERE